MSWLNDEKDVYLNVEIVNEYQHLKWMTFAIQMLICNYVCNKLIWMELSVDLEMFEVKLNSRLLANNQSHAIL